MLVVSILIYGAKGDESLTSHTANLTTMRSRVWKPRTPRTTTIHITGQGGIGAIPGGPEGWEVAVMDAAVS